MFRFCLCTKLRYICSQSKSKSIKIYEKEADGNTPEWFISTLRNGIIHKGPDVNYSSQIVNVCNDGELNKLNCDVAFEWFRNFILDDLLLHSTISEYDYTSIISPYRDPRYVSPINNFDDIILINNDFLNTILNHAFFDFDNNFEFIKKISITSNLHVRYQIMKFIITNYEKTNEL